jgi:deoxyxylulose-5-phosphate synthase
MSKKTERINELANAYASAVFDMFMTSLDEDMLNEINEENDINVNLENDTEQELVHNAVLKIFENVNI